MFRTILVPLDGSPFAEQALPWALSLARRGGASLDLVRAHSTYGETTPSSGWPPYDAELDAHAMEQEQLYLAGTANWLAAVTRVPMTTAVVRGFPSEAILERLDSQRADFIVMTTHGRGRLGRFFLGSVADYILRHAAVPVLLIRPTERPLGIVPEPVTENILIPLDGSSLAEQILTPAVELARLLEARCTLMRVMELGMDPWDRPTGDPDLAEREAQIRAYLEKTADPLRARGLSVTTHVVRAERSAQAILEQVASSDVVALATHGRGGVRRLLVGSVADKVIRGATGPVLVYRPGSSA
jgi:nucleotide-binding universal stress UspA family protein